MKAEAAHLADTLPPAPYPGLRPFETSEWSIFFGRERMTDEVIELLGRQRVVVVHGSSGSGKSSLIRAGVLPRLARQHLRHRVPWQTCAIRPSGGPLWNLAAGLAGLEGSSANIERIDEIRRTFDRPDASLDQVVADLAAPAGHVCILIDQFEEIFRYARESSREEVDLLIELLQGLLGEDDDGARVHVVVTMRSEFLGDCARFAGLAEAINRAQYLLPPMDRDALLRAIRRPAELYGGHVTEALAERLIADAGRSQDELPLIQHGLMLLWHKASKTSPSPRLDLEHYEAERGLAGMLSDHADAVMRSVAPDSEPGRGAVVEGLFRALIDINAEGQAIRRPQRFKDLVAVTAADPQTLRSILDAFRAEGVSFVTPYAPAPIGDDTVVDISHEALIRCWSRIADEKTGWLQREFQDGLTWRTMLARAGEGGVLTPAAIEDRERWMKTVTPGWTSRYGGGWDAVEVLMRESRRARNRARLHTWSLISLLGGLLLLASWGGWAARSQATRTLAQKLAAQARLYQDSQPEVALLLAAEGANRDPTPETTGALLSVLQRHPMVPAKVPEGDQLRRVLEAARQSATSPHGKTLAIGHQDGTITLRDVATGSQLGGLLLGHDAAIKSLAFASDRILVSSDDGGTVLRWPVGLDEWTKHACRMAGSDHEGELRKYLGDSVGGLACSGQPTVGQPDSSSVPSDMVFVPAGWFWMGCNEEVDKDCFAGETRRRVHVDAFAIDRTEVTVAAYRRCVDEGACSPPQAGGFCNWQEEGRDGHPINCVDWDQARRCCDWLGKRLPREEEWEKAARGTEGFKYPWGNDEFGETSKRWANVADEDGKREVPGIPFIAEGYRDGYPTTAPVGKFPDGASPYGAYDMSGNVWEWVWDKTTGGRGVRGGSWYGLPIVARASSRASVDPRRRDFYLGFRCAQ